MESQYLQRRFNITNIQYKPPKNHFDKIIVDSIPRNINDRIKQMLKEQLTVSFFRSAN